MRDNILQNIDQPQNNPLDISPPVITTKVGTHPRFRFLYILIALIAVPLITSLIIVLTKKHMSPVALPTPTPIPTTAPTTTEEPNTIPTIYQTQFQLIETNLKSNAEILPPQIDPKLGL